MENQRWHTAKQVYPSDRGLHLKFGSPELAQEFFKDGMSRGIRYELEGCTVIKLFNKVKRQNPIPDESGMGQSGWEATPEQT
jgi:hypothetical protein